MNKINPLYTFQASWIRYKNNAGLYTAFLIVYFLLSLVVSGIVAVLSTVSALLSTTLLGIFTAFLVMGYAHVARLDEEGQSVAFGDFFHAFRSNAGKLLQVTLLSLLVSNIALVFYPEEVLSLMNGEFQDNQSPEELMMQIERLWEALPQYSGIMTVMGLFQLLFGIGFQFAPYCATLEGKGLLESIQWSFVQAFGNFWRILATYVLLILLIVVGTIFTLGLGLLVLIPFAFLVNYDLYDQLVERPSEPSTISGFEYEN
jgi:hypothetical protein